MIKTYDCSHSSAIFIAKDILTESNAQKTLFMNESNFFFHDYMKYILKKLKCMIRLSMMQLEKERKLQIIYHLSTKRKTQ